MRSLVSPESLTFSSKLCDYRKKWSGLKTFVVVERQGERNDQLFYERQFYICSQCLEAQ